MNIKAIQWIAPVILLVAVGYFYVSNQNLAAKVKSLQAENEALAAEQETETTSAASAAQSENEELTRLRKDNQELLRLRNEVRLLRDEKQQLNSQVQTAQAQAQEALTQVQTAQAQAQQANAALTAAQTAQPLRTLVPGGVTTQEQMEQFRRRYGVAMDATASQNACVNNLRHLDGAKQQWALENRRPAGSIPSMADLAQYLRNQVPACPGGGTYSLNALGTSPTCTVPGHTLGR